MIRQRHPEAASLAQLIERARARAPMPEAMRQAQRRSFAYGNVAIENPRITWQLVDRVASEWESGRPAK